MKNSKLILALILASLFTVTSCASMKVQDMISCQNSINQTDDLELIRVAIIKAGLSRNWIVTKENKNEIILTYSARAVSATVSVKYDKDHYTISYVGSNGLLYDGTKIHRNYNRWIRNLDKDIQINLRAAVI